MNVIMRRYDDSDRTATYHLGDDPDLPFIEELETKYGVHYVADVPGPARRLRYIYPRFSQALAFALGETEVPS